MKILENILEDDYELNVQFHQAMRECIFCFAVANYEEKLSFEEWQKNNYGNYVEKSKLLFDRTDLEKAYTQGKHGGKTQSYYDFEEFISLLKTKRSH